MKYVFMQNHQAVLRVKTMARVLHASRSDFYAWLTRRGEPSPRQQARQARDIHVLTAFNRAKQRYGAPRLTLDLRDRQIMKDAVFSYIEIDYNRYRRHSANGWLSPEQYERKNLA